MLPDDFLDNLYNKHKSKELFPPTSSVSRLITKILLILFPEQTKQHYKSKEELEIAFAKLEAELLMLLASMQKYLNEEAGSIAKKYIQNLPEVYYKLNTDIDAILNGDPAAKSEFEVIRAYPGFYAIAFYRLAHELYRLNVPFLPRILTEFAHSKTGIDIHPAATIDINFYIDHGTGLVIGETAQIGKHVKLYQGITLGALSVSKDLASQKRHPTIEDRVVIYSGATILGGNTTIGHDSIIGGNVWLTHSIAPYTKVYHQPQVKISE
ncbi:MAG TPA: serine O-acetyltransferase EpsC [Cytophagaceae bacterium]|jgi:serine O-acetyltransferase|nr:serine O-acetyltransferase EpsC [Cytophagaceae bacterium]